jgi:glucose 1-dehydrogenase
MKGLFGDKVILITGGGGGIGWAICREFAREGAQIAIIDINETKGQEVLLDVRRLSPGHRFYHQDIRDINAFSDLLGQIDHDLGRIDVLINNAGVNTDNGFLNMTPEAFDHVLAVNLRGHFFLSQKVAQAMIAAKTKGVILFTTSVHQNVVQGHPHYSASKSALVMLIKEMAVELAPDGIRVVGIAPGGIYIDRRIEDPGLANDEPTVLLGGKNGIPRDIGRAAVMLASDYWSRQITGEVLVVSGGQYLHPV